MYAARCALVTQGSCALILVLSIQTPALAQTSRAPSTECAVQTIALTPPAPVAPAFSRLFENALGDFRRLPSRQTVTWLGMGAVAAIAGHTADWSVTNRLSGSRDAAGVFAAGKTIGGAGVQLGGALAAYTIGRVAASPHVAELGADLLRALIVAQTLTGTIKVSVRRLRPDGNQFSFPSGHTSAAFASATVLQRHFGRKAGVPAYTVASYVAASRIQARKHFLSDVTFAAAIGMATGRTVTIGRGQGRFLVAPMATVGGGGVSFTLIDKP